MNDRRRIATGCAAAAGAGLAIICYLASSHIRQQPCPSSGEAFFHFRTIGTTLSEILGIICVITGLRSLSRRSGWAALAFAVLAFLAAGAAAVIAVVLAYQSRRGLSSCL